MGFFSRLLLQTEEGGGLLFEMGFFLRLSSLGFFSRFYGDTAAIALNAWYDLDSGLDFSTNII